MAAFLSPLDVTLVGEGDYSVWRLDSALTYQSDIAHTVFEVNKGFVTDFTSTKRLPVVYLFAGNIAQRASALHDYLYGTGVVSRKLADGVFLEALRVTGYPWWRRWPMWAAVRIFGASHYSSNR